MRVRTDEKRHEIMAAAAAVFGELGFERASMAAIARRAGASKQTIYSYFESKEDLFSAVMLEAMETQAQTLFGLLDLRAGDDARSALETFGRAYLDFVTSPEVLALTRIGIAAGADGALGPRLHARGPERGWGMVRDVLERWHGEGRIATPDASLAAFHLKGLLEAGLVEPRLFGAQAAIAPDRAAREAVRVFLAAYGREQPES